LGLKFIESSGVSFDKDFTAKQILSVVKSDKKADGDTVNFVLTSGFGKGVIKKIKIDSLAECL
jgi:3-dehydroquinate synthetase